MPFIGTDSLTNMNSHPQRNVIWQELHARPYVRFSAPAHVFHFAFLTGEGTENTDQASLARLKKTIGFEAAYETNRHAIYTASIAGLGRLVLAWEGHTEFVVYTFFLYELEIPFQPFGLDFREFLPEGFLDNIGAPLLVATRVAVGSSEELPDTLESLNELFEGHTVNRSKVKDGRGEAWSCYRVHADGFGRIALVAGEMSANSVGRTLERLLAIEDLYHLILLSLPLAREIKSELTSRESRVVLEMEALRVADSLEQKRAVLNSFLSIAADIENLRARVSNRFNGSAAYFSLLESRFVELREVQIERALGLSRFVMR